MLAWVQTLAWPCASVFAAVQARRIVALVILWKQREKDMLEARK